MSKLLLIFIMGCAVKIAAPGLKKYPGGGSGQPNSTASPVPAAHPAPAGTPGIAQAAPVGSQGASLSCTEQPAGAVRRIRFVHRGWCAASSAAAGSQWAMPTISDAVLEFMLSEPKDSSVALFLLLQLTKFSNLNSHRAALELGQAIDGNSELLESYSPFTLYKLALSSLKRVIELFPSSNFGGDNLLRQIELEKVASKALRKALISHRGAGFPSDLHRNEDIEGSRVGRLLDTIRSYNFVGHLRNQVQLKLYGVISSRTELLLLMTPGLRELVARGSQVKGEQAKQELGRIFTELNSSGLNTQQWGDLRAYFDARSDSVEKDFVTIHRILGKNFDGLILILQQMKYDLIPENGLSKILEGAILAKAIQYSFDILECDIVTRFRRIFQQAGVDYPFVAQDGIDYRYIGQ
jgi:hypothetical protein